MALEKTVNRISVPVLPFVHRLQIYLKLLDVPTDTTFPVDVIVMDENNWEAGHSPAMVLRNYRPPEEVPGVDTTLTLPITVTSEGQHEVKVAVSGASSLTV